MKNKFIIFFISLNLFTFGVKAEAILAIRWVMLLNIFHQELIITNQDPHLMLR